MPKYKKRSKRLLNQQRNNHRCEITGKVCFRTHEAALLRGEQVYGDDLNVTVFSAYRCQHCKDWHLTAGLSARIRSALIRK